MEKRIDIYCSHCGSRDVQRDAAAEWDVDLQEWVLVAVYDSATCDQCGGYTKLAETELPDAA